MSPSQQWRHAAISACGAMRAQSAAGRGQGGRRAAAAVSGAGPPVAAARVRRRQQPHPPELPELRGQLPERRQPESGAPAGTSPSTFLHPLPSGGTTAPPGLLVRFHGRICEITAGATSTACLADRLCLQCLSLLACSELCLVRTWCPAFSGCACAHRMRSAHVLLGPLPLRLRGKGCSTSF